MTTAHDIERSLYDWAPRELAMAWDNVGLLVGDPAQEVRRVLVALDITQGVAEEAVSLGAQMIVSHHPVMNCAWHEVQTLRADDAQGRLLRYLVQHGLAACCMHTNLDAADGGVNDCLAHALGLSGLSMLNEEKIGRIGTLSCEIPLEEFLPAVVKSLGCSGLRFRDGGKPVHRVAVGGGACRDYIPQAIAQGCDTFVTADLRYNDFLDTHGLNLIDAGHYPTENVVCEAVRAYLAKSFPLLEVVQLRVASRRHSILSVRRRSTMSGHSKWHNIQKTKGAADAKRSAAFTKIAKEIIVAVKQGGSGDPANNSRLATVIAKAKADNMPNDNIKRTIDKALGSGNTDNYESVTYEGYGPGGVAVIVEALTDNRQRTAPEVRHYFDKFGKGNLGAQGCVSWSFDRKGVIVIDNEDGDYDEDTVMMDALEAGAADFTADGPVFEITTDPDAFNDVIAALEAKGYTFASADISLVPQTYVKLTSEEDVKNMEKLLDMLEDNEDVQNTYHNWETED